MDENRLFKKWNDWLSIIHTDIQWLLTNYYIYKEIHEIVKKNENIQKNNAIFAWMSTVCTDYLVMGIRRQIDKRKDSISIVRLIEAIKKNPKVIYRKRFVGMYEATPNMVRALPKYFGNRDFDKLAGVDREYIDPKILDSDIIGLKLKAEKIKEVANKMIAHIDEDDFKDCLSQDEIEDCLDYLEALLKKYLSLFRATDYDIIPVFQFDWLRVLREPWII
jgi:hypothetical protein